MNVTHCETKRQKSLGLSMFDSVLLLFGRIEKNLPKSHEAIDGFQAQRGGLRTASASIIRLVAATGRNGAALDF